MMKICAVIPAYNEEATIGQVVTQAKRYLDEVIVISDGSSDGTFEAAAAAGAHAIQHVKNKGKGLSLKLGCNKAREFTPDIIIFLDGDGQHTPDDIPKFIRKLIADKLDIVIGSRFLDSKCKVPRYRRFGQKCLDFLTNIAAKSACSDTQSGFRAFSWQAIEKLEFKQHGIDIESGILIEAKNHNLRIGEVPISARYDIGKHSYQPFQHGLKVMLLVIRLLFSHYRVLLLSIIGFILLACGLLGMVQILQIYFATQALTLGLALLTTFTTITGIFSLGIGLKFLQKKPLK